MDTSPRVDHYLVDRRFSVPTLWRVAEVDTDEDGEVRYYLEDAMSIRSQVGGDTEVWINSVVPMDEETVLTFEDLGRAKAEVPAHLEAQMAEVA